MINESRCLELYLATQRHFRGGYDFFKYNGKIKLGVGALEKRPDKYFFQKIANNVTDETEAVELFVSNFSKNPKAYIRGINSAYHKEWLKKKLHLFKWYEDQYLKFKQIESPLLCEDEFSLPNLIKEVLSEDLDIEFFIVFDYITGNKITSKFDSKIGDNPVYEEFRKRVGIYTPFIIHHWNIKEYKKDLLNIMLR